MISGGLRRIVVSDDGCGIDAADAVLAFQRHATSKIATASDLEAIQTLGFRGEALPSIAAVSKLTLTTKRINSGIEPGVQVYLEGGAQPQVKEIGCPEGTVVAVDELFFNTPVRRKFLKGERTEFGHIHEMVLRFALAYPTIRFRFMHDGRVVLAAQGVSGLPARVAELFGADLLVELLPLQVETPEICLHGYCGRPTLAKGSAQSYCFVNGRPIRDRVIVHAIGEGYRTYLPSGMQPFVICFLTMDSAHVDVNVHPTKAEVRFAKPGAVHDFIARAIQRVLSSYISQLTLSIMFSLL